MFVSEDAEAEVTSGGNVQLLVVPQRSGGISGPSRRKFGLGEECGCGRIRGESSADVGVELFGVHDGDAAEDGIVEVCRTERRGELFGGENRAEVLRINGGIVATSLFKVDVPSSSQSIRLSSKTSRAKADDHVKRREELGPASLAAGEKFRGAEVNQVLVIRDNINWR